MPTPNLAPMIAAATILSRISKHASNNSSSLKATGRVHDQLTEQERARLRVLLRWCILHREEAEFSQISIIDKKDGDTGFWYWKLPLVRIELSMTRAKMIEIFRNESEEAEVAFIWNNILCEWNDVILPAYAGRGYFSLMFGLRLPKSKRTRNWQLGRILVKRIFRTLFGFFTNRRISLI